MNENEIPVFVSEHHPAEYFYDQIAKKEEFVRKCMEYLQESPILKIEVYSDSGDKSPTVYKCEKTTQEDKNGNLPNGTICRDGLKFEVIDY